MSVTSKNRDGQRLGSEDRKGTADCDDDVMSVIENNGEVTLPKSGPLLTKKEVAIVAAFGAGILALVLARIANG